MPETCGIFVLPENVDGRVPSAKMVAIADETSLFNLAASLDQVAHEWGHGVIEETAKFDRYNNPFGLELHEGFADVIGQMVEKIIEPETTYYGFEQSIDWDLGEDLCSGCYFNSGSRDDGPSGHTAAGYPINFSVHKDDPAPGAHAAGNRLNVVFKLLTDGGQNRVCDRPGAPFSGCGINVTGLGFTRASRILFDTIQWYTPASATWEQLATYASLAAFERYRTCRANGYNAWSEQRAVDKAFGAIGYPRTTPENPCDL